MIHFVYHVSECRSVKNWNAVASQLEETLNQTCANSETLVPSVQIGILGSLAVGLQHVRIDSTKGTIFFKFLFKLQTSGQPVLRTECVRGVEICFLC